MIVFNNLKESIIIKEEKLIIKKKNIIKIIESLKNINLTIRKIKSEFNYDKNKKK